MSYNDENLTISSGKDGDEMNIDTGLNTELPDDFPEEIPLTDDASIMQVANMSEGGERYYIIMYFTEEPVEDVVAMYRQFIDSAGFEQESEAEAEELFEGGEIIHSTVGEEEYFTVSILQDEDGEDDVVTVSMT